MQHDRTAALERALCALEGLSVGDAWGGEFFTVPTRASDLLARRTLLPGPWSWTDDTNMALSVVQVLGESGTIDQDLLAASFAEHFDFYRGYGPAMLGLLTRIGEGEPWQGVARGLFGGQGSYGNGAAMRAAPVGSYFAPDLAAVVEQARRSAEVTHAHPEGIAGAIAVALAAAWAWRLRDAHPPSDPGAYIERVLELTPPSDVRDGLQVARALLPGTPAKEAVEALGNGSEVTAQDTVPFCLWCAAQHLHTYEDALWMAASGLGDVDTTCAIVGGIVVLSTGVAGIPARSGGGDENRCPRGQV